MESKLSKGAIKEISCGAQLDSFVLQVLGFKHMTNTTPNRYRLKISDGKYTIASCMLATQLNDMVDNELTMYSVFSVTRYIVNSLPQNKKVMIILNLEILVHGNEVGKQLGSPVHYEYSADAEDKGTPSNNNMNIASKGTVGKPSGMSVGSHPIASLTPYQNKWTICARVTNKSNIRTWSNSKGEGKLFSMDLLDESGEIRATVFQEQCDKFYDMIEVDKVYYISQAQLKTANKQYSSLKNDYEMTFNSGTQVTLCHEIENIPQMKFEFVSIADLEQIQKDAIIDIIGICKETANMDSITQKSTGRELKKRDLQIVDESGKEVRLTLWGTQAEKFEGSMNPVVAVKGVKVSDFNGKSLSCLSHSTFQINPDIKECHKLRAWYENFGSDIETVNISGQKGGVHGNIWGSYKTIGESVAENLGCKDQADFYSAKVMPSLIRKENCLYSACPSEGCNKKVIDMNNGIYRCEKCNKEYDNFNWRLLLNVMFNDATGTVWATLFQDQAESLLGTSAQNLADLRDQDENAFQMVFAEAAFKEYVVKLRVKMETYNDESRLKTTIVTLQPLNLSEYNKVLLSQIKTMGGVA